MSTYILNKYTITTFKLNPEDYNVLIRISSPFEEFLPLKYPEQYREILELKFYDFEKETAGLKIFDEYELEVLLNFFERHKFCRNMVIHCEQGISRSAAVAVGWLLYNDDRASIYKIYHGKKYMPNKRIVDMFIKKLKINKRFTEMLHKWNEELFKKDSSQT